MTSRSSGTLASPRWVGRRPDPRGAGSAPPALAPVSPGRVSPIIAPASRADAPRFERAARRGRDTRVAAALVTLWVVLWTVFTAGVVIPAAAVHGEQARPSPVARETAGR